MKSRLLYLFIFLTCIRCGDSNIEKTIPQYQRYLSKLSDSTTTLVEQEYYLDSISDIFNVSSNTLANRTRIKETAALAYNLGYSQQYFKLSKELYRLSKKGQDTQYTAQALYYIGDYYEERAQSDSAFYYYSKSNNLYSAINDTLKQVKTSLYKAGILFDEGIYNESEAEILKTLKLLDNSNETRYLYECYNLLSISLSQNSQYKEALFYQYKALQTLEQLKKTDFDAQLLIYSQVNCYNNMGNTYDKLLEFDKAEGLYSKGLATQNLKRDKPFLYAMLLNNLGNNLMLRHRHQDAYPYLLESLKIRDSLNLKPGIITSNIRLGDYHIHFKDTTAALEYWKNAYNLARETRSNDDIMRSLKLLSYYDVQKSQFYSDLCLKINDSLKKVEIQTRNKFARIQYETNEIEQKNEFLIRRISLMGIAFGVLAVFVVTLFFIFRLQSKNKQLRNLQQQQHAKEVIYKLLLQQDELEQQTLHKERNRIAKELHDGIINTLFSIKLHIDKIVGSDDLQKKTILEGLENASEQIRRISHDLKDPSFARSNFSELIQSLVEKQSSDHTVFEALIPKNTSWSNFSYNQKINIYRLLQEALQNVIKHANSTHCLVILQQTSHSTVIKIQDNGVGFNTSIINKGIGLRNFDERVKDLDGTWTIDSKIGIGTTLKVIIEQTDIGS